MNHLIRRFLLLVVTYIGGMNIQAQQGFFLNSWQPKNITPPAYDEIGPLNSSASASVTIHGGDTITRIPLYMFGDNANAYTTSMSDNKTLMNYLSDRKMGVLRGPSGSISDVYFWNRSEYQPPADVPETLKVGGDNPGWPWYGKRPNSWDAGWTMDIDSFYRILAQTQVTGMLTVNYGYARYGTSADPVGQAAHLAADWVRYDNGRTKFWEIGNEVFGNWEAGYRIDTSLNQDGQPEYISGKLYGQHCRVFIDSMKAAAAEKGIEIFIGAVAAEGSGSGPANWNVDMMKEAGDVIDYYIIHSYYTPWNQNSNADVILKAPSHSQGYINYLNTCASQAGKPMKPVALTEYNVFAVGGKQMVSQIGGMFAVLVTGETIKAGYGAALRWDLANGYSNGDDHGMYSYGDEPGVTRFSPRPAFYYLYYAQKYLGDVMLKTTLKGSTDIKAYSSAFTSGHISTILANTGLKPQTVRVNIENVTVGDRYYLYTLVGGTDVPADPLRPFSRKVYVNGEGPSEVAGGPLTYKSLKAKSGLIGNELLIELPPYSVAYVLADTGANELVRNDTLYPVVTWNQPAEIVYGTNLSSAQLNATANMPGSFLYTPASGTKLNAGIDTLTVVFTPNDTNYTGVTKSVLIHIKKAIPVVQWTDPADIPSGTELGDEQLNATASVDGIFEYTPPAGTIPDSGINQVLQVTFFPDDTVNYDTVTKSVSINVYSVTGTTGIDGAGIKIYPVPVKDQIIVTGLSQFGNNHTLFLQVMRMDGSVCIQSETKKDSASLNLSDLPAGLYLLHISSQSGRISRLFLKE